MNYTNLFLLTLSSDKVVIGILLLGILFLFFTSPLYHLIKNFSSQSTVANKAILNKKRAGTVHKRYSQSPFKRRSVELFMQILITFILLGISFFIVLSPQKFDDGTKNWAFGAIGSIVGYWFPKGI